MEAYSALLFLMLCVGAGFLGCCLWETLVEWIRSDTGYGDR